MKIYNLYFPPRNYFKTFTIDRYTFTSNAAPSLSSTYNPIQDWRQIRPTATLTVNGQEILSIIYSGGKLIDRLEGTETDRTFLDDVLLMMSLCLGRNIFPEFIVSSNEWPVIARNHLDQISKSPEQLVSDLKIAVGSIKSPIWQDQHVRGFHLRMLYHAANVLNTETRFLAFFVLWEWLYARLTGTDKETNISKIISYILKHFWPQTNALIFNPETNNIFQILRNQLAHYGVLPITNRGDPWMRNIDKADLLDMYIPFFTRLTQVLVLKTIDLHCERRIYGFKSNLETFLSSGKL